MTKSDLIAKLMGENRHLTPKMAEAIVNAIVDTVVGGLADGRRIEIRRFGAFFVKERGARQGRNPHTGDAVDVAEKRVPFFKAGKELRRQVDTVADPATG